MSDEPNTEQVLAELSSVMQGFTKQLLAIQARRLQRDAVALPPEPEPAVVRLVPKTEQAEQGCVAALAELLERARRGEFREFAFAATGSKEDSEGHMVWTKSTNQQRLLGQVLILERCLIDQVLTNRSQR